MDIEFFCTSFSFLLMISRAHYVSSSPCRMSLSSPQASNVNSNPFITLTLSSLSIFSTSIYNFNPSLPFNVHWTVPLQANAFLKLFIVAATGSQTYTGLYPDNKQVDTPLFCLYATMILLCSIPLTLIALFVSLVFILLFFF